jgi:hypothetical protein
MKALQVIGILVGAVIVFGVAFIEPGRNISRDSALCRSSWQPGFDRCPVDWSVPLGLVGFGVTVIVAFLLIMRVVRGPRQPRA